MQVNKYFSKTFYVKYGMLIINEKLHINNHPIQQNNFLSIRRTISCLNMQWSGQSKHLLKKY